MVQENAIKKLYEQAEAKYRELLQRYEIDRYAFSDEEFAQMDAYRIIQNTLKYAGTRENAGYLLKESIWCGSDGLWSIRDESIRILQDYVDTYFPETMDIEITGRLKGRRSMLPEGWKWEHYEDGSGSLQSPDGKTYFQYDLYTKEFKTSMEKPEWVYMDDFTLRQFVRYAEDTVLEKLYTEREKQISDVKTKAGEPEQTEGTVRKRMGKSR